MHVDKALQLESEYLSGMEHNFEQARGKLLRGSHWKMLQQDEADELRALMARHKKFDRRLLSSTPKNRRLELHGYERPWYWFGKKRVGVAIASVLSPIEWHVLQGDGTAAGPPVSSRQLMDHVRSIQVATNVEHVIGVLSPTGFDAQALTVQAGLSNVTLVLIEPGETGGWKIVSDTTNLDPRVIKLFDPEDEQGKIKRVTEYLEDHSAELLTGSLAASSVAVKLDLPEKTVARAFHLIARKDPELHAANQDGELLIYRGAASEQQESFSMSMVDKIRQLFGREGDESQKINELSKRRAALSQRRDRLYDDIAKLEKREADLVSQGKQNKSQVVRRRVAAQLAQLRKDIQRQNTTASMLNKQINVLSTDIHNLTLIQQGQKADLPTTEELTENAVKAEEMLETLSADADLVGSLETGISDTMTSAEELEILKEFEAADHKEIATGPQQTAQPTAEPPTTTDAERHPAEADNGRDSETQRREPEAS